MFKFVDGPYKGLIVVEVDKSDTTFTCRLKFATGHWSEIISGEMLFKWAKVTIEL